MTNHPNRNRTARAERIVDVVLAEFGQAVIHKISMRDAMVAACAAALIDREGHQTPCLSALASGDACQPENRPAPHDPTNPFAPTERHDRATLKRCAICGFVIDTKFAAEKPTVRIRP
jgi:hypothetical protein